MGIVVVGKILNRTLLRWVAGTHLREVFTAFSLLLVVGVSGLMESLRISMGLGAFLTGVILADSEYRHALEMDIEPFKGLLLGLFFMAIGMSLDLSAVVGAPGFILGLLAIVMLVKAGILILLSRWDRMPRTDRPLFSLLLSQLGEFAFVIFTLPQGSRIFSTTETAQMMAVTALSMAMSLPSTHR